MSTTFQTTGVNQKATVGYGTNYPFADTPADTYRYLLSDLFLAYDDDDNVLVLPFRVTALTAFGTAGDVRRDMVIVDSNDVSVFDTSEASDYIDRAWGTNLRTLQWRTATRTLRCVMRTATPDFDPDVVGWGADITPAGAVLDPRTCYRMPKRVRSLIVGATVATGDIEFVEGNNIRFQVALAESNDGGRRVQRIFVRARPGDGLGRVNGCDDPDPPIRRINTVKATETGEFTLETADCYRLQRITQLTSSTPRQVSVIAPDLSESNQANYGIDLSQLVTKSPYATRAELEAVLESTSALHLMNDCAPCCDCDDYVRVYRGLVGINNRFLALGDRAEAVRDALQDAIDRWEAQKACRTAKSVRLMLVPESRGRLFVAGMHCNLTPGCITDLTLRITLQGFRGELSYDFAGDAELKCAQSKRSGTDTRYDEVSYSPIAAYPVYDTVFDLADPQAQSRFFLRFKLTDTTNADTMRVTLSAHATQSVNAETGQLYSPPHAVEVPADVQTIWDSNPPPGQVWGIISRSVPIGPTAGCEGC